MAAHQLIPDISFAEVLEADSTTLRSNLKEHSIKVFQPTNHKELRLFSSKEAASWIGITDSYLRQLVSGGDVPTTSKAIAGRHLFSLEDIHAARRWLGTKKASYIPNRRDRDKLQSIAVANFKGGSGKTTTSIHLAQYLAMRGFRVLAVDLDPQASFTTLMGFNPEFDVADRGTIWGALEYDDARRVPLSKIIKDTYVVGLDLVPANIELQEFEWQTASEAGNGNPVARQFHKRIASALLEVESNYDVVVFDCPPQMGYLTLSAMCAATSFILSVHPQMLDIASMSQFLNMSNDMIDVFTKKGLNLRYDWMRYLITRHEPHDIPQINVVTFLRTMFRERVLGPMMVKSTAISDAGLYKQTLYDIDREKMNRGTYERAIESVNAVNNEFERLILAAWGRAE
ncbi:chromosome partitioning protein [Rhizobiales bacterium GAS191]|nr:chromosome partitioning protein [Rhizobiales bacterium GAS191]